MRLNLKQTKPFPIVFSLHVQNTMIFNLKLILNLVFDFRISIFKLLLLNLIKILPDFY